MRKYQQIDVYIYQCELQKSRKIPEDRLAMEAEKYKIPPNKHTVCIAYHGIPTGLNKKFHHTIVNIF